MRPKIVWMSVITYTAVKENRYEHIDGILYEDGKILKYGAWAYRGFN